MIIYGSRNNGMTRRTVLQRAASLVVAPAFTFGQQGDSSRASSLIVRQTNPDNLESPFPTLDSFFTPTELFYVRGHFDVPKLTSASHRIQIEGAVNKPFTLSMDQLRSMLSRKVASTLECAGNGRAYLVPKARGVPWELGAVSNAEWTGVPLAAVLERAGVKPDAVEVVLVGADGGEPKNDPKPPGRISFFRSIPIAKARRPEVLLAYQMNGKDLPAEHGFPVRAVVPGYYGMASVKWLSSIRVVQQAFPGYWQTTEYAYWDRSTPQPVRRPLQEMMIKSAIARPSAKEVVSPGQTYRIRGAAWTGESEVNRVEVSTDGGTKWSEARLLDSGLRYAWRRWEYEWHVPSQAGKVVLMARATDAAGNVQPDRADPNFENYAIHHTLPVEVQVSA